MLKLAIDFLACKHFSYKTEPVTSDSCQHIETASTAEAGGKKEKHLRKTHEEDACCADLSPDETEKDIPNEVRVVLLGKMGAGKTTLINNLFGGEEYQSTQTTKAVEMKEKNVEYQKNDITLKVFDSIGLKGAGHKARKKTLKALSAKVTKVDLVIYCLSVTPGARFEDGNPDIMKSVRSVYGKISGSIASLSLLTATMPWTTPKKPAKELPWEKNTMTPSRHLWTNTTHNSRDWV